MQRYILSSEENDELKINSGFLKGIISSIVKNIAKKKLNKNLNLEIYDMKIETFDRMARLHIDVDVEMPKEDLKALIFEKLGIWS